MIKKDIGTRMKEYEATSQTRFINQMPIIIRIDGKAFHTFTKRCMCETPFDRKLHNAMVSSMRKCMDTIMQNAVLGYTQSDEISILLKTWPDFNTEQWFGGKQQKIVSVSASAITAYFNKIFESSYLAMFDARAFQMPISEVANYFIWRQQDAERNSIQMYGRSVFSHKELQNKSCPEIIEMLYKKDMIWKDLYPWKKRGTVISCNEVYYPRFIKERNFIDSLLLDVFETNLDEV